LPKWENELGIAPIDNLCTACLLLRSLDISLCSQTWSFGVREPTTRRLEATQLSVLHDVGLKSWN
jgi:hypothetical protein